MNEAMKYRPGKSNTDWLGHQPKNNELQDKDPESATRQVAAEEVARSMLELIHGTAWDYQNEVMVTLLNFVINVRQTAVEDSEKLSEEHHREAEHIRKSTAILKSFFAEK